MIYCKERDQYADEDFIDIFLLSNISKKVKLSPFSRGWPEGSLFNSYNTEV